MPQARTHLIARLVVHGKPQGPREAELMLIQALGAEWHAGRTAKFLLTPGGFVFEMLPAMWTGGVGWRSTDADLKALQKIAEPIMSAIVTDRVHAAASGKVDVITIGLDMQFRSTEIHAELVAVCEVAGKRRIHWTGKSYPTSGQERSLVQVTDLSTHCVTIARERVLVLGCHDLNMFSNRSWANQVDGTPRNLRSTAMRRLAKDFAPTVVLQHPHSTDTERIWSVAWSGVQNLLPSVTSWSSGIAYYRCDKHGVCVAPRQSNLDRLCAATRGGTGIFDIIVQP